MAHHLKNHCCNLFPVHLCHVSALKKGYLKGSYDDSKNNIILCIWCNAICLRSLRFKKHIIFHILYIIVAPLCPAFLKHADFYKAHRSEKRGVLWLARYPVCCDWPNTSGVLWNVTPLTIFGNTQGAWRQQYYSENRSYAFFLCLNIWAVLCNTHSDVDMWGRV